MFLNKLIEEHDNWSEELKNSNIDKEQFKAHMGVFRDHFLKF